MKGCRQGSLGVPLTMLPLAACPPQAYSEVWASGEEHMAIQDGVLNLDLVV